jgi:hypothetical protein
MIAKSNCEISILLIVEGWIGKCINLLCQVDDPTQQIQLQTRAIKLVQTSNVLSS